MMIAGSSKVMTFLKVRDCNFGMIDYFRINLLLVGYYKATRALLCPVSQDDMNEK